MPLEDIHVKEFLLLIFTWFSLAKGTVAMEKRITTKLQNINYKENSNNFVFDNQILSQIFMSGYRISEVSCPTLYADDSSSISFFRSIKYGLGVLKTSLMHVLHAKKVVHFKIYDNPTKNSSD